VEEVVFWNGEINNYDGVFTHTDIIRVVLRFYRVESTIEEESQLSTRDRILLRMKSVTITEWFKVYENEVTTLVKAKMDERLHDACRKLVFGNIHRIIIIDNDSRMLVGTIQQRDILVYLIKGYS
jgi:5'-AMP-activated protein kinase, regulatory gamma subunit